MRAFFHPDQRLHTPQQFMRAGRLAAPQDVPARVDPLLAALAGRGIAAERPADRGLTPALAVHTPDFLDFLAGAWGRWAALPNAGPEVLPNLSPYWNGTPGTVRPPCRSASVVAQAGHYLGDLAVPLGEASWTAILASTWTAAGAAEAVLGGDRAAYALCRPSGHHARADRASGFCYLNNAAIAAQALRGRFAKVAVLDIDAHHGDGTQEVFYGRGDVLTVSLHADPAVYYPFYTGYADERGVGAGEGANLNLPLAPGTGDDGFHAAIDRGLAAVRDFGAEALVVSLGFDSHAADPIGLLKVSTDGFAGAGARIAAAGLPTVVVQEGGYEVGVIGDCLGRFLDGFGGV
ncbi:acetoin utilization deacetylase AcuC-like enzyme [Inquilinus ginsengisoli]|uniref:Acetoin utilization deacetylase AcuC-like enzyme n=1 Tax=Inquilinus ginsengisoli TaxID=363840 RepID=A0ABU1JKR3_9PROT|nr:histone deacetylase family protein [Inquilinus ginsengisoli]MDR6289206.1 acetoin utilization deacetylase AcuC-like enzyme [Inquilinus ginsengisoli]